MKIIRKLLPSKERIFQVLNVGDVFELIERGWTTEEEGIGVNIYMKVEFEKQSGSKLEANKRYAGLQLYSGQVERIVASERVIHLDCVLQVEAD